MNVFDDNSRFKQLLSHITVVCSQSHTLPGFTSTPRTQLFKPLPEFPLADWWKTIDSCRIDFCQLVVVNNLTELGYFAMFVLTMKTNV